MSPLIELSKIFFVIGLIFIFIGLLLLFFSKVPFLGRLPGDILIEKRNFTFYFPISSCILLSILLSFILYLFFRK